MRHTEGPWSLDFGDDGAVVYKEGVATIANIPDDLQASSANARLIVEAPALLAALEAVAEQLSDLLSRYNSEDYTAIDAAHAAIARARGVSA